MVFHDYATQYDISEESVSPMFEIEKSFKQTSMMKPQ